MPGQMPEGQWKNQYSSRKAVRDFQQERTEKVHDQDCENLGELALKSAEKLYALVECVSEISPLGSLDIRPWRFGLVIVFGQM